MGCFWFLHGILFHAPNADLPFSLKKFSFQAKGIIDVAGSDAPYAGFIFPGCFIRAVDHFPHGIPIDREESMEVYLCHGTQGCGF